MISMERTKAEKDAAQKEYEVGPSSGPDYPYGLCLTLQKEELAKLGITDLPEVGDEMEMDIRVKVVGVRSSASEGNDASKSVDLQITHIGGEEPEEDTPANTLYGSKK
jgi:hypothetical protein